MCACARKYIMRNAMSMIYANACCCFLRNIRTYTRCDVVCVHDASTRVCVKKRFVLRCNAPNMRSCMNTSCRWFACVTRAYTRFSTRVDVQTLHMRKHNRHMSNVLCVDKRLLHYACTHIHTYTHTCMCMRVCMMHVCMSLHTCVCMWCVCVYVHVCMYHMWYMHDVWCMCVCVYVHMCIDSWMMIYALIDICFDLHMSSALYASIDIWTPTYAPPPPHRLSRPQRSGIQIMYGIGKSAIVTGSW
jgi:hypothetical protein